MKKKTAATSTQEIELKLALPWSDAQGLMKRLVKSPLFQGRKAVVQTLHNVYFDTPDQALWHQRSALRVRQIDAGGQRKWIQTLKTRSASDSALSRRGEWESESDNGDVSFAALDATPWATLDPDGAIFAALAPSFITHFERASWRIEGLDRSIVEIALDIGQINARELGTPICELELELKSGHPSALFDLAQKLASIVPVLPLGLSKSDRGQALALGTLDVPRRSRIPVLAAEMTVPAGGQAILREMYGQFTENLDRIRMSDNPEVVHQARIGWRRLKTAFRLLGRALEAKQIPDLSPLEPLLMSLGQLRDLDVVLTESLPALAVPYVAADLKRKRSRARFEGALVDARQRQCARVIQTLNDPDTGDALLSLSRHIEELSGLDGPVPDGLRRHRELGPWAAHRVKKLQDKLEAALQLAADDDSRHRARIVAKRLRYALEALAMVLPKRRTRRWLGRATHIQNSIGVSRDVKRAWRLAQDLDADPGLTEFLRGYALPRLKSLA